nr:carcinoembryonic antigen-related cell adhesion molecule 18 isoform X1 [Manis javanica]
MDICGPRSSLWKELVLVASLLAWGSRQASGQLSIIPDSLIGVKGYRSLLTLENVPENVWEYSWHRGAEDSVDNMIVSYRPPSDSWQTGPVFSSRQNVTRKGDLVFKSTELQDAGNYTVRVDSGNGTHRATGWLEVRELERDPVIWANTTSVGEDMDPVAAFCHTNGTNIKWYVNYIPVSSNDRMTISPDGKTLVILRVSRHDKELHCSIESIPEIVQRSDVIFLDVAYGPDSAQLWSTPTALRGIVTAELGSQVQMECTATSEPRPKYYWSHNGSLLSFLEKNITLLNLTWEQMGRYRCVLENPVVQLTLYREVLIQAPRHIPAVSRGFSISGPLVVFLITMTVLGSLYVCGILIYALISHLSTRQTRLREHPPKTRQTGSDEQREMLRR